MPSANKTPNIGLNQWAGNEYPKRQDFVDDNSATDIEIGNLKKIAHGAVADLAALKAIDTTNLADNITIIVKSLGFYRFDSASSVAANDSFVVQPTTGPGRWLNDLASHSADTMTYSTSKTGLDANGIYTEIDLKRHDNTLIMKSVLSGGTSPKYTTRTETYYASDGITVKGTVIYTLTYDTNGNVSSEVIN